MNVDSLRGDSPSEDLVFSIKWRRLRSAGVRLRGRNANRSTSAGGAFLFPFDEIRGSWRQQASKFSIFESRVEMAKGNWKNRVDGG